MSSHYSTDIWYSFESDKTSLDTIEEHFGSSESKSDTYHLDPLSSDTEMSLGVDYPSAEPFDFDIEMTFGVNPNSSEPVKDEDLEDPDAEEEFLAREKEKLKSRLEPCLFCSHCSNSFDESLAHIKANHDFNIPDTSHLDIDTINLVRYLRHIRPNSHSTIVGVGLDDFAGPPSTASKFVNQEAPGNCFVRSASEARRIYLKALHMYRRRGHQAKNLRMRTIQDEVGSEFLYNTFLKMGVKERRGLNSDALVKLGREISAANVRGRERVRKLRSLALS
ncbi:tri15-putative transcription factor [Fusarium sporotrichioides]|uniref:Tri15-putative transcription factor n=1 Tax=Fusarium sporotrichioides TaxID=5514 RepID=A0A395RNC3_FUSSP|nr:tri15-putative transcription factor [Fusarium sporotrichioides]